MPKYKILLVFIIFIFAVMTDAWIRPVLSRNGGEQVRPEVVRLGERLFRDDRFSTPNGDLPASCSNCHLLDEDPQGLRAYADFFNRSWVSSRSRDHRRLELRNSPTIFDVAEMPRLHYDGEFASLEDLVKGTLSGRPMGWLPGEESEAFDHARAVVLNDRAEANYPKRFKEAFDVDLEKLDRDRTVGLIAKALADYCRTLKTRRNSAYDRFIKANGLDGGPAGGENAKGFNARFLAEVSALESQKTLKLAPGFDQTALLGLKIFFRAGNGNCATCHTPPRFTDDSFHNIGISQLEYDRFHGDGAFASLAIPNAANAVRPSMQFREMPSKQKPGQADLGFWNFVDLKANRDRRAGESDDDFLRRMVAAFKTPTLRNLKYTQPYFHDGSLQTMEELLAEMIRLSEMARAGRLREADRELAGIRIAVADIPPLAAFLNSLNDELKWH